MKLTSSEKSGLRTSGGAKTSGYGHFYIFTYSSGAMGIASEEIVKMGDEKGYVDRYTEYKIVREGAHFSRARDVCGRVISSETLEACISHSGIRIVKSVSSL